MIKIEKYGGKLRWFIMRLGEGVEGNRDYGYIVF